MGKILFWILVILGGLVLARVLARHNEAGKQPQVPKTAKPAKGLRNKVVTEPEPMVRCAHCNIHLPRSEALLSGGQTWCSQDHAKLGHRP